MYNSGIMKKNENDFRKMKNAEPVVMLTAYTYPVARCLELVNIPILLVGDTWGMVEMGFSSTRDVTMDQMCDHIAAVRRGAPETHIIGDLPYGSDATPEKALKNAKRFIEAGADSVKLEGPKYNVIEFLVENDIDVIGHTGLTPQTAPNFKQAGKQKKEAERILQEASQMESRGCFMIILEHIPEELGREITKRLKIPVVGIGAGSGCDGQVLVINDLLGLGGYWPPFSKQYAHLDRIIQTAAAQFAKEVKNGTFP